MKKWIIIALVIVSTITLVACKKIQETEMTYNIFFVLDDGLIYSGEELPDQYKNTDDNILIPNPYKKGYVFTGWSINNAEPMINCVIPSGTSGDLTLVATYCEDITNFYSGSDVDIIPMDIKEYLEAENKAEYLYKNTKAYNSSASGPSPVSITWQDVYNKKPFTVVVSGDENFEDKIYEETTEMTSIDVYNLIPKSTYYYKITDRAGNVVKVDSYTINESLRTIYCGEISNVRDMGGYQTDDGMIKYGLIYRAPEIAEASNEAIDILKNQLGIQTEIDLRIGSRTATIDQSITKYVCGMMQWDYMFPNLNSSRKNIDQYTEGLRETFQLFADESNYPIIFHCTSGADRTGTVAFLLNAFLGASYDDLAADFEITSFYFGARWRSDIIYENGQYVFSDSGVMKDNEDNLVSFDKVYNHIMTDYITESGTLSDAVANYLKTVVGLTDEELTSIKNIMIDTNI